MQWDDVRYFLEVTRQGSLSGSARAMGVEHSTVARHIVSLEASLKLRLFDRLPRGWQLTQEGQSMLPQALAIETSVLALKRLATTQQALSGQVRLSAPPQLLSMVLLPRLFAFRQQFPDLDLVLLGERRISNLEQGEADLALRLGEPQTPDLIAKPIAQIAYGLYAIQQWQNTDFKAQQFIGFDDSMPSLGLKHWMDEFIAGRRQIIRSNDMAAQFQAARDGWGIALLPHFLAQQAPELLPLDAAAPPRRTLYLLMHPDVRKAERVRALADYLVSLFKTLDLHRG
ncbi:LysR family transcriptional regulator [Pseudoduganella sp. FT93W]|uniref:LysR family transcriptional regulator n=1 Tax=Duganella fentianensis TaxID=2692177 RepID=A0A845HVB8_9BURK|nr:LysR family transcriptional regulator [Duganella fentianensis]MYN44782.1 LysR family transcriptional regulator [Duganella fentianensis]